MDGASYTTKATDEVVWIVLISSTREGGFRLQPLGVLRFDYTPKRQALGASA